jgi:tetratricopeptide (TPR) repeat protein
VTSLFAALVLAAQVPAAPGPLVVFPSDGGASQSAWVGEAVADMLPRDLQLLGVPVVDRADRLRAQEALGVPSVPLTRATSVRIAESLGASRIVLGSHELDGQNLTLSLRLLDVEGGTLGAPFRASGPLSTLADLIHSAAWDIALAGPTRPVLSREDFLKRRSPVRFEALRAFAEGLAVRDPVQRQKQLKRALGLAPDYDEARLSLGRLHLQAREHAAAHDVLGKIRSDSPFSRTARFLDGVALLEQGRYRDAAAVYAGLAAEEPTPAVLNNHALALLRVGAAAQPKASDELRRAVEQSPGSREAPFNLGWALLTEGDAEAAAFWLRGVVRQDPSDAHARVVLVWALRQANRNAEADEEWAGLIAVAPSYESLATPDPTRHFERILHSERMLVLEQSGRSDAELAAVHLGRAEKLTEAGDRDGALRELSQAAYVNPYDGRAHLLLARAQREQGDLEKAINELRVSLWCREDPTVRLELAALLKKTGKSAEARTEAQKVLKAQPDNAAARDLVEKP